MAAGLLAGACCAVMVVFPEMALESARKGVALWANSVLPAMLPFFICANFLIALGIPALAGRFFERPFRLIFNAPGSSAFVFFISITSGYPMGPKLIGDLCRRGEIGEKDARKMLAFCSTSGPLFLLGTVGVSMLGSPEAGLTVALAHYGGAIFNGLLWRGSGADASTRIRIPSKIKNPKKAANSSILELFTSSILSAIKTLAIICGYLVLFTLAADFLNMTGALNLISADWGKGFLAGILEMTVGCNRVSETALPPVLLCVLCAFLVSFGGLSVLAQSMSLLAGSGIRVFHYLKVKLTHGILAGILAYFLGPQLLRASTAVGAFPAPPQTAQIAAETPAIQWLFSTQMLLLVLFFLAVSVVLGKGKRD